MRIGFKISISSKVNFPNSKHDTISNYGLKDLCTHISISAKMKYVVSRMRCGDWHWNFAALRIPMYCTHSDPKTEMTAILQCNIYYWIGVIQSRLLIKVRRKINLEHLAVWRAQNLKYFEVKENGYKYGWMKEWQSEKERKRATERRRDGEKERAWIERILVWVSIDWLR